MKMEIKWNKIDWDKINSMVEQFADKTIAQEDTENYWFSAVEKITGKDSDDDFFKFENFSWEEVFHAGLPNKNRKQVLGYFKEDNEVHILNYDQENNTPCFWDENFDKILTPDAWIGLDEYLETAKEQI